MTVQIVKLTFGEYGLYDTPIDETFGFEQMPNPKRMSFQKQKKLEMRYWVGLVCRTPQTNSIIKMFRQRLERYGNQEIGRPHKARDVQKLERQYWREYETNEKSLNHNTLQYLLFSNLHIIKKENMKLNWTELNDLNRIRFRWSCL